MPTWRWTWEEIIQTSDLGEKKQNPSRLCKTIKVRRMSIFLQECRSTFEENLLERLHYRKLYKLPTYIRRDRISHIFARRLISEECPSLGRYQTTILQDVIQTSNLGEKRQNLWCIYKKIDFRRKFPIAIHLRVDISAE